MPTFEALRLPQSILQQFLKKENKNKVESDDLFQRSKSVEPSVDSKSFPSIRGKSQEEKTTKEKDDYVKVHNGAPIRLRE